MFSVLAIGLVLCHIVYPLVFGLSLRLSNVMQSLMALLAAAFCYSVVRVTRDEHLCSLWKLLTGSFLLWSAAQCYYTVSLLVTGRLLAYPSAADALWLAFALPILLIVVRQRSPQSGDWISWLDAGQALLFFSLLGILVFSRGAGLRITQAYDVQGAALVLLCGLQYSRSSEDRPFYRDLGIYLFTYAVFSSSDYRMEAYYLAPGSVVDACWTFPPALFIVLSSWRMSRTATPPRHHATGMGLFSADKIYGTSALGLFLLSLLTGVFLHQRKPMLGYVYVCITSLLFAIRMIGRDSQIFQAHRAMRERCLRDSLTGLPNRSWLMDPSLNRLEDGDCLVLCNLDRIRMLNDSLGRASADKVLVVISERLLHAPELKMVFRVEGDEFLLVLRECDVLAVAATLKHLLQLVQQPLLLDGRQASITATLGVVQLSATAELPEALLKADAAVTFGKLHGRNQYVHFAESMLRDATSELAFEASLKRAIDAGDINNHYQPIHCTVTGQVTGFEALARWVVAGRVVATPDAFIPLAEDTWMITRLGRQLIATACTDIAALSRSAGRPLWVSINLSGRQLQDPHLTQYLQAETLRARIPLHWLKIEVTESVFLKDFQQAADILQQLRALGVRIALDDFGTGYSSLSYLAALPFDMLKVDRSFITALQPETPRFEIVRAIVQLAMTLGKEVVAEGIEAESEERHLRGMGCTLLQGYRISRPLPLERALRFVAEEAAGTSASYEPQASPGYCHP